ncbi:hypothetical protein ACQP00_32670 [Dactylosporangium sp. CS-047395]|uniref:hypothetical protein n=1 Tax=Dactylosporangium sp. CS-047395 TaxID=3239936 RepID=UPI003D8AB652
MMAVAALLFAGALLALVLRADAVFWVLAGLAIVWQLALLEHDVRKSRDRDR